MIYRSVLTFSGKSLCEQSYFKPTPVDLYNIQRRQDNYVKGTRQIGSVTSGKGVT